MIAQRVTKNYGAELRLSVGRASAVDMERIETAERLVDGCRLSGAAAAAAVAMATAPHQ